MCIQLEVFWAGRYEYGNWDITGVKFSMPKTEDGNRNFIANIDREVPHTQQQQLMLKACKVSRRANKRTKFKFCQVDGVLAMRIDVMMKNKHILKLYQIEIDEADQRLAGRIYQLNITHNQEKGIFHTVLAQKRATVVTHIATQVLVPRASCASSPRHEALSRMAEQNLLLAEQNFKLAEENHVLILRILNDPRNSTEAIFKLQSELMAIIVKGSRDVLANQQRYIRLRQLKNRHLITDDIKTQHKE